MLKIRQTKKGNKHNTKQTTLNNNHIQLTKQTINLNN